MQVLLAVGEPMQLYLTAMAGRLGDKLSLDQLDELSRPHAGNR